MDDELIDINYAKIEIFNTTNNCIDEYIPYLENHILNKKTYRGLYSIEYCFEYNLEEKKQVIKKFNNMVGRFINRYLLTFN